MRRTEQPLENYSGSGSSGRREEDVSDTTELAVLPPSESALAAYQIPSGHRAKVNRQAADALVKGGFNLDEAKLVISLVARGEIPSVTINY